eukprot:3491967-Amphidinium_carterae.1
MEKVFDNTVTYDMFHVSLPVFLLSHAAGGDAHLNCTAAVLRAPWHKHLCKTCGGVAKLTSSASAGEGHHRLHV